MVLNYIVTDTGVAVGNSFVEAGIVNSGSGAGAGAGAGGLLVEVSAVTGAVA
jgi:hypothetical protein